MNHHTQKHTGNNIGSAIMPNHAKRRMQGGLDKRNTLSRTNTASSNCAKVTKSKQALNFDFAGIAG